MMPVTEQADAKRLTRNLCERAKRYGEYAKTLNATAETAKPLTAIDVCGEFQKMAKDLAKLKKEIILSK